MYQRNVSMLGITILAIGTVKEKYLSDALKEYLKRIGAYASVRVTECREEHLPDRPSPAEIRAAVEREGTRILDSIPRRAYVCALCIEGAECSSEAFAKRLETLASDGCSEIVFIIGGSDGLSDAVKKRADWRLSFSPMTFPHQLMRVILAEQLYRALNIRNGGKYHK
ncbi:MAG: 23S rRNA (pseudouridine(1915)-N(3))-methyltransferase RlmH [Eubacteriales bacterium]